MKRADKNTTESNHETIEIEGIILIAGIIFFATLATAISIYFNDYKLNISCEKKRPNKIAIC